jgi:UDPglucose 6-dehydrogenase
MLTELYGPFVRQGNPVIFMDIPSAEVTKYAANAMLAVRITMMNQFANLCEKVGADVGHVRLGIGSDERIGRHFLYPGPGYGGSCFPKDVKALVTTGRQVGFPLEVLEAVDRANAAQKRVPFEKLQAALGPLKGTRIAVWGLAFKAQTDDMRESAALVVVDGLLAAGAQAVVHDPQAMHEARRRFGNTVQYAEHRYDALDGADGLVVLTEWQEYRVLDLDLVKKKLKRAVIIDARNLYDTERLRAAGFVYESVGRP